MIDVAHIEFNAGGTAGIGTPVTERYVLWSAPTAGLAAEFGKGSSTRFGVAVSYQLNFYGDPGSSDIGINQDLKNPIAHVPQFLLYYGYAFRLKDGSEHGPRVGVGGLWAFEATDIESNHIEASRVSYPGLFAQVGYHWAYALPGSRVSLSGEFSLILATQDSSAYHWDWSLQARATVGALWRF